VDLSTHALLDLQEGFSTPMAKADLLVVANHPQALEDFTSTLGTIHLRVQQA